MDEILLVFDNCIMLQKDILLAELEQADSLDAITNFYEKYLSKRGEIAALYKQMKDLTPEERKEFGQSVQELSNSVEAAFEDKQAVIKSGVWNEKLEKDLIDISVLPTSTQGGNLTLLAHARRKVEEIFQAMGYNVEYGHHMVTVQDNFESVNIPATHPATEMHDTLYVDHKDEQGRDHLMRTHTSAHQVALIKKYGTPCRFVVPGKVYRNEKMDASHDCVFWQIEGVVIDKNISIAHFKHEMQNILEAILEDDSIEMRMRPGYFPFVEPGFEIDAQYTLKNKSKWLEILGAGMIHPNVLENAGLDPNEWSGFAFGIGLTRLIAIKYGIDDIRLLTNADLRFIKSF